MVHGAADGGRPAADDVAAQPARAAPLRLAVLVSGRGSNLQALLDAIAAGRLAATVAGVFSDRAGRPDSLDVGGVSLADALMAPTRLYVKPVLELLRGAHGPAVHAMAHITGGGLTENIVRVVPDGLGVEIDAASWTLPPVFEWLQREGNVAREEMWRTFNCGIGFVLLVDRDAVPALGGELARLGLAHWRIGEVVAARGDGRVRIG